MRKITILAVLFLLASGAADAADDILYMNGNTYLKLVSGNVQTAEDIEFQHVNSGTLYIGGQNEIGTTRVARQQNVAYLGASELSTTYVDGTNPQNYVSQTGFDGVIRSAFGVGPDNMAHTAGGDPKWLQVEFAGGAADVDKVIVFNRQGYEGRMNNFSLGIYDDDPKNGVSPVEELTNQARFNAPFKIFDLSASGSWFRLTNGVADDLNIPEIMVLKTGDVPGYGNFMDEATKTHYVATGFTNAPTGTLVFDVDLGSGTGDVLDVSGTFTAGGFLLVNFQNSTLPTFGGTYQPLITAQKFNPTGNFTAVASAGNALLNAGYIIDKTNLAATGEITVTEVAKWTGGGSERIEDTTNWDHNPSNRAILFGFSPTDAADVTLYGGVSLTVHGMIIGYDPSAASAKWDLTIQGDGHLNLTEGIGYAVSNDQVIGLNALGFHGEGTIRVIDDGKLTTTGGVFILGGRNGSKGTLDLSGNASVTLYGLQAAEDAGSEAKITVAGNASLALKAASGVSLNASTANTRLGQRGALTLTQTGGTITAEGELNWAENGSSVVTANLSGGTFSSTGTAIIGRSGSVDLNISGNHAFQSTDAGANYLGVNNGAVANLNISDNAQVSLRGLQAGVNGGSKGNITISGGTLTLTGGSGDGNNTRLANNGTFTLTQTGGLIQNNANVWVADGGASGATLNLSGGKFITASGDFIFGTRGSAEMNISGDHEFIMSNGIFNIGYGQDPVTQTLTINQTGGTFTSLGTSNTTGGIQVGGRGNNRDVAGTYNLSGGTLNLSRFFNGTNGTGELNITGGLANIGYLGVETNMTGGTINPAGVGAFGEMIVDNVLTITGDRNLQTTNIALHKPASQVSTLSSFWAGNATDGIIPDGDSGFSHTHNDSGTDQWWQVDLGDQYLLGNVRIYNRYGGGARLTNSGSGYYFELYDGTLDAPGNKVWTSPRYDAWGDPYVDLDFGYDADRPLGSVLRLVRDFEGTSGMSGDDFTLNLKEVEVYNYLPLPVIQLELGADNESDWIHVLSTGTLEIQDAVLELSLLEDVTEGKWQLFQFDDPGVDMSAILGNLTLKLPDGYVWNTNFFASEGWISLAEPEEYATPEPAAWVMVLLGIAGAGWMRGIRRRPPASVSKKA